MTRGMKNTELMLKKTKIKKKHTSKYNKQLRI